MIQIKKTPACKPFTPHNFIEFSANYFDALENLGNDDDDVDVIYYKHALHETILLFLDYFEIADLDYNAEIDYDEGSPFYECILEPNEDYMIHYMVTLEFAEIF